MSVGSVGLILLAAGASSRLREGQKGDGTPKQLLPWTNGRSLLRHAAETALASLCRPVVIVLGARREQMENELGDLPDIHIAHNPDWAQGMGASIRAGVRALLLNTAVTPAAAVITLCDQPLVTPALIDALVSAHFTSGKPVVAAEYDGTRGVPALFSHALFDDLLGLDGAQGAKHLIAQHGSDAVHVVPFPGGEADIDTLDDYERLRAEHQHA